MKHYLTTLLTVLITLSASAQVGEHRSELAAGINGGLLMSSVGFVPKVPQDQHIGATAGITLRYTSEKYFNTICAIVGEVNLAQGGWKESILDKTDQPVINSLTGLPEEYSRTINYVQVPVLARLGWGRERQGIQAFFQAGPQVGYMLSEKTTMNFSADMRNRSARASQVAEQYSKPVEHHFDYGITAGAGVELSLRRIGHFIVEGRYYYGLGDLYGNSKRDYFGRSNLSNIVVKASYLFDLKKTDNNTIK
jgi:hypothetical protein